MTGTPLCSLIIIHYHTEELLERQLLQLQGNHDLEIIVVDNGSERLAPKMPKYPTVTYIQNTFNQGFAFAANQGLAVAKGEWSLFLNPDVEITIDQIHEFISATIANQYVAASPSVEDSNYNKPVPSFMSLAQEFSFLKYLGSQKIEQLTLIGGCLLIKTAILKELKGWDERFFLWFEDSDLSKRLQEKKLSFGRVSVAVKHLGGVSFSSLTDAWKRHVFFHSLSVYAEKHFTGFEQNLLQLLVLRKYTKHVLLPNVSDIQLSITVPNMKAPLLLSFLEKNKGYLSSIDQLIIVSSDLTSTQFWQVKSEYPAIRLIALETNKGFTHTVNTGFKVSLAPWVGTVNDDITFTENIWPVLLKNVTEQTGSIGPAILQEDFEVESVGIAIEKKGKARRLVDADLVHGEKMTVDVNNAATVIYNKQALENVGIFDEKFGSYLEDIDLSLRLQRHGWQNTVVPSVSVIHHGQKTSSSLGRAKRLLDFKNWIYVIAKNWSVSDLIKHSPSIVIERARNLWGILKFKA